MKVQELIERLKYADPEAEVHFSYNYGDHWRTIVAPSVEIVEKGKVTYSDYHQMDQLVIDKEDNEEEDGQESAPSTTARSVVVLS